MYGWSSFDVGLVTALHARVPTVVSSDPDGGMTCPIAGHASERLPWLGGKPRSGTGWHGDPEVRFHASPTYVLRERMDNFVCGRELIREALAGEWAKAETHRLGHENSEDALTWNVFRSLQEHGLLRLAVCAMCGFTPRTDPRLFLWGREIREETTAPWERLSELRSEIEPWGGQQTEPDCCLYVPGEAWIFVEAKFGSKVTRPKDGSAKVAWLRRYGQTCPGLFRDDGSDGWQQFPEQLLRNVAYADRAAARGERAIVVSLGLRRDVTPIESWVRRAVTPLCRVEIRRASWEDIYDAVPADRAPTLHRYMKAKSLRLRPAFEVDRPSHG